MKKAAPLAVSVVRCADAGIDASPGDLWAAVCNVHGTFITAETRAGARSAAKESEEWCDECSAETLATVKLSRLYITVLESELGAVEPEPPSEWAPGCHPSPARGPVLEGEALRYELQDTHPDTSEWTPAEFAEWERTGRRPSPRPRSGLTFRILR